MHLSAEQLEAAARELCLSRGVDPDRRGYYTLPKFGPPSVTEYTVAWRVAAAEIRTHLEVRTAIDTALRCADADAALRNHPN